MVMKRCLRPFIAALLLYAASAGTMAGQGAKDGKLPERYGEWLDLVAYIIQPAEKDVFLKLADDRERDIFIGMFWKQRDPTPGTPENEYREEIAERFKYVNRTFGRSTVRPGWRTDMGRFYMVLGAPAGIERFETSSFIVPCQAWTYYGDGSGNLPRLFVLLFYQKGGAGEYKLYDAVADGPSALLVNKNGLDSLTGEELHSKLYELAPTLADLSISMVPGETSADYEPSPRNNIILAEIVRSPSKNVNPAYATHFLDYRGVVSTDYLTNFVESRAAVSLIPDPLTGARFLHFSIAPASVSLDFYEAGRKYFCGFQINASLRAGERIVFQYTRDIPVSIDEKDVDRVRANGLSIEDSFPVAPGKYRMSILLLNSVGKEYSIIEQELDVPVEKPGPALYGPFLGYGTAAYAAGEHIPFKFGESKLIVDPGKVFSAADTLVVFLGLGGLSDGLRRGGRVFLDIRAMGRAAEEGKGRTEIPLDGLETGRTAVVSRSFPVKDLPPDYYEAVLTLVGPDGKTLDESRDGFVVSPKAVLGHPIAQARVVAPGPRSLYLYMLADQEDKLGETAGAAEYYRRAFEAAPGHADGVLAYADFLIRTGGFDRALAVAETLKDDGGRRFVYLLTRGRALMGKGLHGEALTALIEANGIYNSDIRALNALGECFMKTGRKDKALEAWKSSLKLEPGQDGIRRLVESAGK